MFDTPKPPIVLDMAYLESVERARQDCIRQRIEAGCCPECGSPILNVRCVEPHCATRLGGPLSVSSPGDPRR